MRLRFWKTHEPLVSSERIRTIRERIDSLDERIERLSESIKLTPEDYCEVCGGVFARGFVKRGPSTIRTIPTRFTRDRWTPAREEIAYHYYCEQHFPQDLKEKEASEPSLQ